MIGPSAKGRRAALLVENRRQARKVRIVCWGSVLWVLGWLFWAADMAQTYGLAPGDGGILRPAEERWAVAAMLAAIGLLPFAGLVFYSRRYIVRLARLGGVAEVTLIGFLTPFRRNFPVGAFDSIREHEGKVNFGGVSVHAPWLTLRIGGKRYIVDRQSEFLNQQALAGLAAAGMGLPLPTKPGRRRSRNR